MQAIRRFAKYFFVFVFISTVFALTASYVVRKYFEEEVTAVIISELNKALAAKVDVKDINFSILSSFPRASLNFRNVIVYSAKKFNQKGFSDADKALVARSVSLRFNLIDLYYREYDIKSIVFEDTHLWLLKDKDNNINYKIWNDSSDTTAVSLSVSLEKIFADNIFLHYNDLKVKIGAFVDDIEFAGQYRSGDLSAICYMNGAVNSVDIDDFSYVQRVPIKLSTNLFVGKQKIEFTNTKLSSNNIDLDFDCNLKYKDDFLYDINLKEANTSISAIQWFLPDSILKKTEPLDVKGNLRLSGKLVKTEQEGASVADFQFFSSGLSATILNHRYSCNGLVNVSFPDLRYYKKVIVSSEALKIVADEKNWLQTKGRVIFSPWQNTKGLFDSDFSVTDELLYSFISDSTIVLSGVFSGTASGTYEWKEQFSFEAIKGISISGDFYNANIVYGKVDIANINCNVSVSDGSVKIPRLSASLCGSPLKSNFTLKSIEPFFYPNRGKLFLKGAVNVDSIDVAIFDEMNGTIEKNKQGEETKSLDVSIDANLEIGELIYNNHIAENVKTHLSVDQNSVIVSDARGALAFGVVGFDAKYDFGRKNLSINSAFSNVSISKFLYEFDNFGQNYLTDKNIEGSLSGRMVGTVPFTDSNTVDRRKLSISSNFIVANGRLMNFDPILEMSKYLREEELSLIQFDTIRNRFSVHDDSLFVPKMSIASSIADFSIYGKQSLDNEFDYHIQVVLSKVLSARRMKRKDKEAFGEIADDGYGRTTVPLRIKGTSDNFKIVYDRAGMKESVANRWRQQNKELKDALKKEFGGKQKTTRNDKPTEIMTDFEFDWGD